MRSYTRQGLTFDVADDGPADGPVVLLLHGFPQDHGAFDAVVPALHEAGLRTLAPDQRGYSRGAGPRTRRAYATRELVEDVVALIDAAEVQRVHLVGHDWGGMLAWSTALAYPERVASLTVLSTPHPLALSWSLRHGSQILKSWYIGFFQLPWVPERVLSRGMGAMLRRTGLDREHAQRYAERFAAPSSLTGPINWYRAAASTMLTGGSPGASREDGTVRVPTTYLWGSRDPFLGRAAAERTEAWVAADYRFVELPAGHWLPENAAETVATEIVARTGG